MTKTLDRFDLYRIVGTDGIETIPMTKETFERTMKKNGLTIQKLIMRKGFDAWKVFIN